MRLVLFAVACLLTVPMSSSMQVPESHLECRLQAVLEGIESTPWDFGECSDKDKFQHALAALETHFGLASADLIRLEVNAQVSAQDASAELHVYGHSRSAGEVIILVAGKQENPDVVLAIGADRGIDRTFKNDAINQKVLHATTINSLGVELTVSLGTMTVPECSGPATSSPAQDPTWTSSLHSPIRYGSDWGSGQCIWTFVN